MNDMKSTLIIFLACLQVVLISSCSDQFENEIEAELLVHFDNFIAEASANGVEISLDQIDLGGYIENIETRGTLGQCKSYSDGSKIVTIDQGYWNRSSDIEREYVVFHELGHCVLGRDHSDEKDENGHCLSIMQSGNSGCSGIYNAQNRNSLLNELFDF